jgi:hypothetical protein
MKRIYTLLIALSSLVVGFSLSSFFYSRSSAPAAPFSNLSFNTANSQIRVLKGNKTATDNNYYVNVLTYAPDSITVIGLDSMNAKSGSTINYTGGGNYNFNAETPGTFDSIPRSTFHQISVTLVDTTIYSKAGILYGKDKGGKAYGYNMSNIVSMQGGGVGTVVVGVVTIDVYE